MKRYLKHGLLFVLILLLIGSALDYIVTTGLRHSRMAYYAEWNDILDGAATSDLLILGSSRAQVNFSPEIIGSRLNMTAYNLGTSGYTLDMQLARYDLYRQYDAKPKVIVQSLDTYGLNLRDGIYDARQFLPYFDQRVIKEAVEPYRYFKWYDYDLPLVRYRGELGLLYRAGLQFLGARSYAGGRDRGYEGMVRDWSNELAAFRKEHPNGVNHKHLAVFEKRMDDFLARSKQEGILVVLVYPPEYVEGQETVTNREEIFAIYRGMAAKYGVEFLDYSNDPICYDTKYFYNSQHMNKLGAELFSTELADRLAQIITRAAAVSRPPAALAPGG